MLSHDYYDFRGKFQTKENSLRADHIIPHMIIVCLYFRETVLKLPCRHFSRKSSSSFLLKCSRLLSRYFLKIDRAICCEWSVPVDENGEKGVERDRYQSAVSCKLAFLSLLILSSRHPFTSPCRYRREIHLSCCRNQPHSFTIVVFLQCIPSDGVTGKGDDGKVIRVSWLSLKFRGITCDPSMKSSIRK